MSIAIAILTACLFAAETADDSKSEMAQLDGEWSYVSMEKGGGAVSQITLDELKLKEVVTNGEGTIYRRGMKLGTFKFTIDPSQTPKTIDYEYFDGTYKGKTKRGIYAVQGETLKVCTAEPDKERPSEFTAKPGSDWWLVVYKRDKKLNSQN